MQVCGLDPLRDEGIAYAHAMLQAGVPVKLAMYGGVPHGVGSLPPLSKFKIYHDNIVNFINNELLASHSETLSAKL